MDIYSPKPTSDSTQTSPEQNLSNIPQLPLPNNVESTPEKRGWLHSRKAQVVIAVFVLLLALGVLTPKKHSDVTRQSPSSAAKPASTNAQLVPVNGLSSAQINSSAPTNEKTYFNTVWSHLDTIGSLSLPMNQSCSVKFPPPEPCASDIQAYQAELLKTKADLDQVSAPVSFQQADVTLRRALGADVKATDDASAALQVSSLTKWLVALSEHAVAGKQLNLAGAQALDVLN